MIEVDNFRKFYSIGKHSSIQYCTWSSHTKTKNCTLFITLHPGVEFCCGNILLALRHIRKLELGRSQETTPLNILSNIHPHFFSLSPVKFLANTVPKETESFVTNNYDAGRLVSETKVFVIDSWRPAAIVTVLLRNLHFFWDSEASTVKNKVKNCCESSTASFPHSAIDSNFATNRFSIRMYCNWKIYSLTLIDSVSETDMNEICI
jgi:hypothetical protein